MDKMNLKDYLGTIDPEQIVAIGSKNGTGFIYIGKAGDKDFINECFDKCLSNANRRLEDYRYKLERLVFDAPKVGANKRKTRENICKYVERICSLRNGINDNNTYINNYIPVLARDVIETYAKDNDNCLAIIINGQEENGFWLKSEFDSKHG